MVSTREGITTLEQVMYKRPDPFMAYRPRGIWGAYETSWEFYTRSILAEVPTRIPVTTRVPFKVTTVEGKTVLKGVFADRIGIGQVRTPLLETGKLPKEFRVTAPSVEKFIIGRAYKTTPLRFPKVKLGEPLFEEPTTAGLVTVTRGARGFVPTRFAVKHDVIDYRLLRYLESLEPAYEQVSQLLPPTIKTRFPIVKQYGFGVTDRAGIQLVGKLFRPEIYQVSGVGEKQVLDIQKQLINVGKIDSVKRDVLLEQFTRVGRETIVSPLQVQAVYGVQAVGTAQRSLLRQVEKLVTVPKFVKARPAPIRVTPFIPRDIVPFYDVVEPSAMFLPRLGIKIGGMGELGFGFGYEELEQKFRKKKTFDPFEPIDIDFFGGNNYGF